MVLFLRSSTIKQVKLVYGRKNPSFLPSGGWVRIDSEGAGEDFLGRDGNALYLEKVRLHRCM